MRERDDYGNVLCDSCEEVWVDSDNYPDYELDDDEVLILCKRCALDEYAETVAEDRKWRDLYFR